MGTFTGVAIKLKISLHAPNEVFQLLDNLCGLDENSALLSNDEKLMMYLGLSGSGGRDALVALQMLFRSGSVYFNTWYWFAKEQRADHILYEVRNSVKWDYVEDAPTLLFEKIKDFLVLEEGDILLRTIEEYEDTEQIYVYINGSIISRPGYRYKPLLGVRVVDLEHPSLFKRETLIEKEIDEFGQTWYVKKFEGDHFVPPWNAAQLDQMVAAKLAAKIRS